MNGEECLHLKRDALPSDGAATVTAVKQLQV